MKLLASQGNVTIKSALDKCITGMKHKYMSIHTSIQTYKHICLS